MRVSHEYKFVFLSRPKCASTSIASALNEYTDVFSTARLPWHHHVPASLLKQSFQAEGWDWNSYFKFVSIRNPWDLVVSLYFYGKPDSNSRFFWEKNYNQSTSLPFKDWLKNSKSWDFKQQKFVSGLFPYSYAYYVENNKNESLIDYVIKVENLQEDLKTIGAKLGLSLNYYKLNRTKHNNYQKYYDRESIEIVERMFGSDIQKGNYSFPN